MLVETRLKHKKRLDKQKLEGVYSIMNKNRYANFTQLSQRRGKTKIHVLEAKVITMVGPINIRSTSR
mgnify:CR=1 FL=1